jgi:hypothetical protein
MNTQEYMAMKSDGKLEYMETAPAADLYALSDALMAEAKEMKKQGQKLVLSGDNSGVVLLKQADKQHGAGMLVYTRTQSREGVW